MSLYLHDIPLSTALAYFQEKLENVGLWKLLASEILPLDHRLIGRVLAEPIWAKISSPHYHASAMDGFAVIAEKCDSATTSLPLVLSLRAESAQYVDTGDPLPGWADAVIPIENIEPLDEKGNLTKNSREPASIRIRSAVVPWNHVRSLGEDIIATQLVLPAGHTLRPVDLGAIAAAGHTQVVLSRQPRVAILPTGSELVPIGSAIQAGDIIEYNSLVMAAQVMAKGGNAVRLPIISDDFLQICQCVKEAVEQYDLVLLNAGSSAGSEDFSSRVVEELGDIFVHGVAVRPGHPVILGIIRAKDGRAVPIMGVPGYPVSAALTVDIFVEPLLAKWLGRLPLELPTEDGKLTRKINSPAGDVDYVRVAVGRVGSELMVTPLSRGAGVITSLVQADGVVILPPGIQGVEAGGIVKVHLYRAKKDLDSTILSIGSHDMLLDVLGQFLTKYGRRLVSANVGSQGGLISLNRGEAHMAGSHLLDPATGEYNFPYIRRLMPGKAVKVVTLAKREQGLIVKKGNPEKIFTLFDLERPEIKFINRQRGSGTRVLLDYHFGKASIASENIHGYAQEEFTHLGVAAAVISGRANCGLAVAAAAQALDLDFVPLFYERYDIVFPMEFSHSDLIAPIFDLLGSTEFKTTVATLGGYDITPMGQIVLED